MMKLRSALFIFFLFLLNGPAKAQEALTFYVVDYPPYLIAPDKDTSVSGVDVELVRAALQQENIAVDFKWLPWKRIVKSMKEGRIAGTVSCSKREARLKFMYFSTPISYVARAIITKQDLDISNVRVISDLHNYKVVTVDSWGMQKELDQQSVENQSAPDLESALKAVRYRSMDMLYMAEYPALFYVKELGLEDSLKVTVLEGEEKLPLHLCISQKYPNAKKIQEAMNKGFNKLKANGLYDKIRAKYL